MAMVEITTDEELREGLRGTPNEFQEGVLFERRRMLNIIEYEINIADSLGNYLSGVYLNRWRKHFLEGHHCHWMKEYDQVMETDWMGRV